MTSHVLSHVVELVQDTQTGTLRWHAARPQRSVQKRQRSIFPKRPVGGSGRVTRATAENHPREEKQTMVSKKNKSKVSPAVKQPSPSATAVPHRPLERAKEGRHQAAAQRPVNHRYAESTWDDSDLDGHVLKPREANCIPGADAPEALQESPKSPLETRRRRSTAEADTEEWQHLVKQEEGLPLASAPWEAAATATVPRKEPWCLGPREPLPDLSRGRARGVSRRRNRRKHRSMSPSIYRNAGMQLWEPISDEDDDFEHTPDLQALQDVLQVIYYENEDLEMEIRRLLENGPETVRKSLLAIKDTPRVSVEGLEILRRADAQARMSLEHAGKLRQSASFQPLETRMKPRSPGEVEDHNSSAQHLWSVQLSAGLPPAAKEAVPELPELQDTPATAKGVLSGLSQLPGVSATAAEAHTKAEAVPFTTADPQAAVEGGPLERVAVGDGVVLEGSEEEAASHGPLVADKEELAPQPAVEEHLRVSREPAVDSVSEEEHLAVLEGSEVEDASTEEPRTPVEHRPVEESASGEQLVVLEDSEVDSVSVEEQLPAVEAPRAGPASGEQLMILEDSSVESAASLEEPLVVLEESGEERLAALEGSGTGESSSQEWAASVEDSRLTGTLSSLPLQSDNVELGSPPARLQSADVEPGSPPARLQTADVELGSPPGSADVELGSPPARIQSAVSSLGSGGSSEECHPEERDVEEGTEQEGQLCAVGAAGGVPAESAIHKADGAKVHPIEDSPASPSVVEPQDPAGAAGGGVVVTRSRGKEILVDEPQQPALQAKVAVAQLDVASSSRSQVAGVWAELETRVQRVEDLLSLKGSPTAADENTAAAEWMALLTCLEQAKEEAEALRADIIDVSEQKRSAIRELAVSLDDMAAQRDVAMKALQRLRLALVGGGGAQPPAREGLFGGSLTLRGLQSMAMRVPLALQEWGVPIGHQLTNNSH